MNRFWHIAIGLITLAVLSSACGSSNLPSPPTSPPSETITNTNYVGAEKCFTCHMEIYDSFMATGHPYKLYKITGRAPSYPTATSPGVPDPPAGYTWDDITYAIGGFGWKARFMDRNGYIITGNEVQYNFANSTLGTATGWGAYNASTAPGTLRYDCGRCHTTGYDANGASQNNLAGVVGNWQIPGISCEACHGPGARHTQTANAADITIDRSAAQCGTCHYRNANHTIAAKSGMIEHHEQYDELILGSTSSTGGHTQFECITCHDVHKSALYDTSNAIKNYSENYGCTISGCHAGYTVDSSTTGSLHTTNNVTCLDCHMPYLVKSAVSVDVSLAAEGGTIKKGDVRAHIFKMNTDASASQFSADGNTANPYVTVKYSCNYCHTEDTVADRAALAVGFHGN